VHLLIGLCADLSVPLHGQRRRGCVRKIERLVPTRGCKVAHPQLHAWTAAHDHRSRCENHTCAYDLTRSPHRRRGRRSPTSGGRTLERAPLRLSTACTPRVPRFGRVHKTCRLPSTVSAGSRINKGAVDPALNRWRKVTRPLEKASSSNYASLADFTLAAAASDVAPGEGGALLGGEGTESVATSISAKSLLCLEAYSVVFDNVDCMISN
jgi:hypothetical protein